VGPLPKELFTNARKMIVRFGRNPRPVVQPLRPGEWTIIIAHEPREMRANMEELPSEERLRYAFVTLPNSATAAVREVVIADMKSFLERVMIDIRGPPETQDLLKFWDESTGGLADVFGVCGKEEIASVLEVIPGDSSKAT
jgi:hypothetical protein